MPPGQNYHYTVRTIWVPEDGMHSCTGKIVAVLGATYNASSRKWYLTVLVERPGESDPVRTP